MHNITLGNRLKVARAERNLSQEELASIVGVTRQTISSIETGQYCPSALLAFLLANKLEKPVADLFFIQGERK
jgi:putative transcriptional regulator